MFHNIVDHVGLMHQHQHCLIELKLQEKLLGLISISHHKYLFHVKKMIKDVMVENQLEHMSGCTLMRLLMKLVQFILLEVMTMAMIAHQLLCAETVILTSPALFQMNIQFIKLMNTLILKESKK